ncbi:hypothetical protein Atai01_01380 [Amycolatopsis taiwanensis]|uniref:Uncharacterized protein n=1 Tax=Amycolatopsis taiwanensis TaxID=342230 RepID=A0A9W6VE80_9PSEU|nr:hypothetical protein Atai01_01380 [Amycolatopsis taiwanensis]
MQRKRLIRTRDPGPSTTAAQHFGQRDVQCQEVKAVEFKHVGLLEPAVMHHHAGPASQLPVIWQKYMDRRRVRGGTAMHGKGAVTGENRVWSGEQQGCGRPSAELRLPVGLDQHLTGERAEPPVSKRPAQGVRAEHTRQLGTGMGSVQAFGQ